MNTNPALLTTNPAARTHSRTHSLYGHSSTPPDSTLSQGSRAEHRTIINYDDDYAEHSLALKKQHGLGAERETEKGALASGGTQISWQFCHLHAA